SAGWWEWCNALPNAKPTYIAVEDWGQNGCIKTYTLNGKTVNSFTDGPLNGNDTTGTPWTKPPYQGAGWPFQIFPYIEQGAVQQYQAGVMRNIAQPAFVCPTRRGLIKFKANANNNGGRPLDYASPYFGPVLSDALTSFQTESTFFGIILP